VSQRFLPLKQVEVIRDLSQFAILTRATNANAEMLGNITFPNPNPPFSNFAELELDAELAQLNRQAIDAIARYQKVRHLAQSVRGNATMLNGAALQCVLPMMYAILGTLAYLLQLRPRASRDDQRSARTERFTARDRIHGGICGRRVLQLRRDAGRCIRPNPN
jgi:hypothetical protein